MLVQVQPANSMPGFSFLMRSAVSYVQWCLCSSQTERYRKTGSSSLWDHTVQGTSFMIHPLFVIISQKLFRWDSEDYWGGDSRVATLQCGQGRRQMRKLFCASIHSAGNICFHLSSVKISFAVFGQRHNITSPRVRLCVISPAGGLDFHNFPVNPDP